MMVIDQKNKIKDAKSWAVELLRYQGKQELAEEFEKWIPPKFPVSGNILKAAGVPRKFDCLSNSFRLFLTMDDSFFIKAGKPMNMVIQRLRNRWKESDFELKEEELAPLIPNILEDLGLKPQK